MTDEFLIIYQRQITRPGAESFLLWLQETDFFTAPASTRYHGAFAGGLATHSVNVARRLLRMCHDGWPAETIALCGLLHDVCKTGYYTIEQRNVKNEETGKWEKKPYFGVDDRFPYGHGEKSVHLITRHMALTDEEAMAIRWHMGGFDDKANVCGLAFSKFPLSLHLHVADLQATYLDENLTFPENNER